MGLHTAPNPLRLAVGSTRLVSVSYDDVLDSGESLTGTVTIAEDGAASGSTLTLANASVSSAALTINHKSVAAGRAVQFKASGMEADTTYSVKLTVATDSTPAQTLVNWVTIEGVSE